MLGFAYGQTPASMSTLPNAAYAAYASGGTTVVETYTVTSMTHAVSVGNEGSTMCPAMAGAYFEDHATCSTLRAAQFFGLAAGGGGGGGGSGSGSGSGGGGGGGGGDGGMGGGSGGDPAGPPPFGACNAGGGGSAPLWLACVAVLALRRRRARAGASE